MWDIYSVEGIDLRQGVERYGNEAIYTGILRSWHLHTPALLDKIKRLTPETLPEYTVTIHGLKGASYGICADEIGDKAGELEALAKSGNFAPVEEQNPAFIEKVELLIRNVGELLQSVAGGKTAGSKAPMPDSALLEKLLDAVKRYKSSIMEEVMAELETYEYETGGEIVVWLREQIDNLEYETIQNRLESL